MTLTTLIINLTFPFLEDKLWLGTNVFKNATFLFVKHNATVRGAMVKCEPEQMELMEDVAQKILKKMDSKKVAKLPKNMPNPKRSRFQRLLSGTVDRIFLGS